METVTLKEYAQTHNVSYEAVRRQVIRHKKELSGHVIRQGRQQLLDEWAVDYLDQHRRLCPVSAVREDQNEIIQKQAVEIDALKNEIIKLHEEITKRDSAIKELQGKETALIETKIRNDYLLEDKARLLEELKEARTEASSYHRSFFGFYRKDKQ